MLPGPSSKAPTASHLKHALQPWRRHGIYLDRGVLVINKPPGLASQPAPQPRRALSPPATVLPILEWFAHSGSLPWPCHRLDKNTTGALICSRNPSVQRDIHKQFAAGEVERRYLAVLRGGAKTFSSTSSVIRAPLRSVDGSVFVQADEDGVKGSKLSETRLKVLASSPIAPLSLVELEAKTGRRHQLRVHAAHIGAPILGDSRYAKSRLPAQITDVMPIPQDTLYLHASYVSFFRYRATGQNKRLRLGVMAPLPRAFVDLCQRFSLHLPEERVRGGVYVDGEREESGVLPDLGGRWL